MTISAEQRARLDAALPVSAVTERSQSGKTLSYVQGWWVIGEMNAIFGPAGWSYEVETHEAVRERTEDTTPKGAVWRWHVSYRARCILRVGDCVIADVGHGHGIDRDCGQAIESAEKEAATDALKRCAKSLGWRLGLALYDRTREHVADETAQPSAPTTSEADLERLIRDWPAMPEAERRAAWASLDAESKAKIRAAVKGGA